MNERVLDFADGSRLLALPADPIERAAGEVDTALHQLATLARR